MYFIRNLIKVRRIAWQQHLYREFIQGFGILILLVMSVSMTCMGARIFMISLGKGVWTLQIDNLILRISASAMRFFAGSGCLCGAVITIDYGLAADRGYPNELYRKIGLQGSAILADHGDTIAEVIARIRHEPVEYMAAFNGENKIDEVTSLMYTTVRNFSRDMFSVADTMIHNHPNMNSAFSSADLTCIVAYRLSTSVVITRKMLYIMKVPQDCREYTVDQVKEVYEKHLKMAERSCESMRSRLNEVPCLRWFISNVDEIASVMACSETAAELGWVFTAEPYKTSDYAKQNYQLQQQKFMHVVFGKSF